MESEGHRIFAPISGASFDERLTLQSVSRRRSVAGGFQPVGDRPHAAPSGAVQIDKE